MAQFKIDTQVFSQDIIFATLFLFLDRAYVFLQQKEDGLYIHLEKKEETTSSPKELMGEIANELLNTMLRDKVTKANATIREEMVLRGLGYSLKEAMVLKETTNTSAPPKDLTTLLLELEKEAQ